MIVVGVSVYLCEILYDWFVEIVNDVGVKFFVDMVYYVGFVVGGVYYNLVFCVDFVIFMIYKMLWGFCLGVIFCK